LGEHLSGKKEYRKPTITLTMSTAIQNQYQLDALYYLYFWVSSATCFGLN